MRFPIQTRFSDYDAMGHVNNAVYLAYFELGRVEAWRVAVGDLSPDFILAEARISYRSPAMVNERLVIEVTTTEVRTKAWVWRYRILQERDERLVADGETTQVMFDYANRVSVPIPALLREMLARI